ncbi:MAG: porin [Gammaproteobacteria bacterium]
MLFYDDGEGSDAVQSSDNGTTLGNRITIAGSADLPSSSFKAGFEVILEPLSVSTPLIFSNQDTYGDTNGSAIGVLGNSAYFGGPFGKITLGLQSMPTDNIAVLADPSLTLWSAISPVFRGNGFTIRGTTGGEPVVWGDFLGCYTAEGLSGIGGIGIDCNGIYRNGVRYDLPALGPVSVAIGYANDDVYDIAAKYSGQINERIKAVVHVGYAINKGGVNRIEAAGTFEDDATTGDIDESMQTGGYSYDEASNFQAQFGLMDSETGLFGTFAFQKEDVDGVVAGTHARGGLDQDDTTAWWFKGGIKRAFSAFGDTAITFQYGQYHDQYAARLSGNDITGSQLDRIGFSVDQYFGSKMIIYAAYENLDIDVDGPGAAYFANADSLDILSLGFTYFF